MRKQLGGIVLAAALVAGGAAQPASAERLGKAGGLVYVRASAPLAAASGDTPATKVATCPEGTVMAGGGARVTESEDHSFLATVGPSNERRNWDVGGWHYLQPQQRLTAFGVCGKESRYSHDAAPDAVPGGPVNGNEIVDCPAGFVTGGGVHLTGDPQDWWLSSSYPVDGEDADLVRNDAWRGLGYHRQSTPPAALIVTAVCRTGAQPRYRKRSGELGPGAQRTLRVRCPRGTVVTGGGGFTGFTPNLARITETRPFDSKDKGRTPEDGWVTTFDSEVNAELDVTAHAVCV